MDYETSRALDVTRTSANYAVVLIHAWAAEQYVVHGTREFWLWYYFCNMATAVALPALFLISGYLMAQGIGEGGVLNRWGLKMIRRIRRLFIPFVAWNLTLVAIWLGVSKIVPRMAQRVESFQLTTWQGIQAKTLDFMTGPLDLPLWFMRTIFIYAFASVFIWWLLKRWKGVLAYLLLGVWFVIIWQMGWARTLAFKYPWYSLVAFVLGMHLANAHVTPFKCFKSKLWILVGVVVPLLQFVRIYNHVAIPMLWDVGSVLLIPTLFAAAPLLQKVASRLPCWAFVQKSSFFLYAGHFFFCSIVLHTLAPCFAWWTAPGKMTFLIFLFCTVGVVFTLGAYWAGKKFCGKMFGIWDGTL